MKLDDLKPGPSRADNASLSGIYAALSSLVGIVFVVVWYRVTRDGADTPTESYWGGAAAWAAMPLVRSNQRANNGWAGVPVLALMAVLSAIGALLGIVIFG